MAEGNVLVGGKTFLVGDTKLKVLEDPLISPVHVDVYTEARVVGREVYLSPASVVIDAGSPPEARVGVRLRMSVETAAAIQGAIQDAVARASAAAEEAKKTAN